MWPRRQKAIRRFIEDHLALKPLERIPGKTKALRGRYRGILQWDIDNSFRLHYRVNSSERLVEILYIGPHPKW
jgi:mRNA-degrading endonuclease RelE of RelBE toxin-antitoxin system